ncbi:MAG: hypothetical protein QNJ40_10825 [Xanthomonadales bacterium]|nr:hypothetical protein [Xanthomonadales bacterium]
MNPTMLSSPRKVVRYLKKQEEREVKRRRKAARKAQRHAQLVANALEMPPPDSNVIHRLQNLAEEWSSELAVERKGLRAELTDNLEGTLLQQRGFQDWYLSEPTGSKFKWVPFPADYFQGQVTYTSPMGQAKAKYKPLSSPVSKDKENDLKCNRFALDLMAVEGFNWKEEYWDLNSAYLLIGAMYEVPGSMISQSGIMDIVPLNQIAGIVWGQSFADLFSPLGKISAGAWINETCVAVGQTYGKGGGILGTNFSRSLFSKEGKNIQFNTAISEHFASNWLINKYSVPVVQGVGLKIYTYTTFDCDAFGVGSGAGMQLNFESSGLLLQVP